MIAGLLSAFALVKRVFTRPVLGSMNAVVFWAAVRFAALPRLVKPAVMMLPVRAKSVGILATEVATNCGTLEAIETVELAAATLKMLGAIESMSVGCPLDTASVMIVRLLTAVVASGLYWRIDWAIAVAVAARSEDRQAMASFDKLAILIPAGAPPKMAPCIASETAAENCAVVGAVEPVEIGTPKVTVGP